MARVKIENVVDHLSSQMRRALEDAIRQELPEADFDPHQLFRTFKRAVQRRCNQWERVPDHFIDAE